MYLGLKLQEHLDSNVTAQAVAQSASRALGFLIAKCQSAGILPYNVFSHLYDSTVWPTISYCSAIWRNRSYSYINAVQYRAMRYFLVSVNIRQMLRFRVKWDGYPRTSDSGNPLLFTGLDYLICLTLE